MFILLNKYYVGGCCGCGISYSYCRFSGVTSDAFKWIIQVQAIHKTAPQPAVKGVCLPISLNSFIISK